MVAADSPDRNWAGISRSLLSGPAATTAQRHPIALWATTAQQAHQAASAYEDELVDQLGPEPVLDIVHLGLGDDGHTASWPSGDPVLEVTRSSRR